MKIIPEHNVLTPIKIGDEKVYYYTPESRPIPCIIIDIVLNRSGDKVYLFRKTTEIFSLYDSTICPHKFKNP